MSMSGYLDRKTEAKRLAFKLHKLWGSSADKTVHPWDFTIVNKTDTVEHRFVHSVRGYGCCYGDQITFPDGRTTMAVTVDNPLMTWDGDNVVIENDPTQRERKVRTDTPLVMVRLFTPWLKDKTLPPWRILRQVGPTEFMETQALGFKITGSWFGKRHDFPLPTGPKMHIGCFGEVTWDGQHAYITT